MENQIVEYKKLTVQKIWRATKAQLVFEGARMDYARYLKMKKQGKEMGITVPKFTLKEMYQNRASMKRDELRKDMFLCLDILNDRVGK
ncbi:hypothetical protein QLX41_gp009 [Listeria phage LMTA-94]|uniref:Uncharacterized protein n=7 Tax=Pecentumvirus TaxID=1857844 RepID=A0A060AFQ5_9CAUD|nr:hypothetical protein HH39_gp013 [Listeria phage LMSP-25]YP_009044458.1 hypothetical protein LP083-2_001 [Listeria phage LP-083-2]YP_009616116.1 hypothetical protein FDI77_gp013 [Listeria phage LMTA-34]YP_009784624.1 hypothetical protein QLX40_gp112 [Listeria phage LP-124]YP_009793338.1 hypothetical protein QLX42_gp035 [Listeria phage LMTA-57]YP_009793508.1 hypothetical protein QLX41_gp009 [Listeria phage LMTA-94]QDK05024.2 hypothetical protein FK486_0177 [Listeria phage LP-066]AHL19209.1 